MSNRKKVIIVGGGIGGLATAVALQKMEFEVTIVERFGDLRPAGAGLTVWSNATRAIDRLGLMEEVNVNCKRIENCEIRTSKGKILSKVPLHILSQKYGTPTIGILRSHLHSILWNHLKAVQILLNAKCTGYEQYENEVIVSLEDGREIRGDLLIGADGIHSTVRNHLIGEDKLRYGGYTAWRGFLKFEHKFCLNGLMYETWGNGIRFGFVPVGDNQLYWYATKNALPGEGDSNSPKKIELLKLFSEFPDPIPTVIQETEDKNILRNDIFDRVPIKTWVNGRVVLVGDAAHPTTPNLGQGACLALEDAVVLADSLKQERDINTALKTYESKRVKRANFIGNSSWQIGKIAQWQHPIACWIRNQVLPYSPIHQQQKYLDQTIGYRI